MMLFFVRRFRIHVARRRQRSKKRTPKASRLRHVAPSSHMPVGAPLVLRVPRGPALHIGALGAWRIRERAAARELLEARPRAVIERVRLALGVPVGARALLGR